MVQIAAPSPFLLRDCLVTIGVDDFRKQVSKVEFVPTSSQVTWQGMSPDATVTENGPTSWAVNIEGAQDWQAEDSLCNYLLENEGASVPMVFEPIDGGTSFATVVGSIVPPSIGGTTATQPTFSVSMGCSKPVRTLPA